MFNEVLVGTANYGDGALVKARGTKEGATLATELHGKYYEACLRGNIFTGSSVIAGLVIPVAAATLNSKFTLWNPAGSNVNVEILSFSMGMDTATQVVQGIGLMVQRNLTGTSGIPTSTTAAAALPMGPAGGVAKSNVYTQATLTNVAIPGVTASTAVPIPFVHCFTSGATTAAGIYPATRDFDGTLVIGPDSLVAAVTSVAASAQNFLSIVWAEWPV